MRRRSGGHFSWMPIGGHGLYSLGGGDKQAEFNF
jgi:hypothetical protein